MPLATERTQESPDHSDVYAKNQCKVDVLKKSRENLLNAKFFPTFAFDQRTIKTKQDYEERIIYIDGSTRDVGC